MNLAGILAASLFPNISATRAPQEFFQEAPHEEPHLLIMKVPTHCQENLYQRLGHRLHI